MDYITTQQLKQEIIKLGFKFIAKETYVRVTDDDYGQVADLETCTMYTIDTGWDIFRALDPDMQKQLYDLLDRYARTPLDKRVREKKYQLKLDVSDKIHNHWQILAKNTESGVLQIGSGRGSDVWQTVFTESEIKELGDVVRGFVKKEVFED